MDKPHILIVEDEQKIAAVLRDYLDREGYHSSILDRGDAVVNYVKKHRPALLLLDIMLPGLDGRTACREIRSFSDVPIIMITARVEESDRLIGLELGADDYICKPFSPREVVARVKAILRRTYPHQKGHILTAGPVTLDQEGHSVAIHGEALRLTPNEFALLKTLMARPHRVFTRSELVSEVQGYDFEGYERTIDSHMKNLRKKIASLLPDQELISTVYGVGYKLNS